MANDSSPCVFLRITWVPDTSSGTVPAGLIFGYVGSIRIWSIGWENGHVFLSSFVTGALPNSGCSRVECASVMDAKRAAEQYVKAMGETMPVYENMQAKVNDSVMALMRVRDALDKAGMKPYLPEAPDFWGIEPMFIADRLAGAIRALHASRPETTPFEPAPAGPGWFIRIWLSLALALMAVGVLTQHFR